MKENWEDLFRVRYNGLPPAGGRVLVAEPFLRDGGFGRSVVYLTDHNEEGSVGFVLNKPLRVSVESVVAGLEGVDFPVYYGGPVGRDSLYYIHRRADIPGAVMVGDGVFHGGDFDVVTRLAREGRLGEGDIRFFAGYSGWSAGQNKHPLMSAGIASRPRRTVSLRLGRLCSTAGIFRSRQSASASRLRVTTTRFSKIPSVASKARQIKASPPKSARSLFPPKRRPKPEAMITHPSFPKGRSRSAKNTSGLRHSSSKKGSSCLRTAASSRFFPIRARMASQYSVQLVSRYPISSMDTQGCFSSIQRRRVLVPSVKNPSFSGRIRF